MSKNNSKQKTFAVNLKTLFALAVISAALGVFSIAGQAVAAESYGAHGYTGPGPDLVTVQQALSLPDDSGVTLKGKIVKSLGDESYTFQDATGSIEVEIDHEIWRGQQVGPNDTVVIIGEMDKDWTKTSVDVSSLILQ